MGAHFLVGGRLRWLANALLYCLTVAYAVCVYLLIGKRLALLSSDYLYDHERSLAYRRTPLLTSDRLYGRKRFTYWVANTSPHLAIASETVGLCLLFGDRLYSYRRLPTIWRPATPPTNIVASAFTTVL